MLSRRSTYATMLSLKRAGGEKRRCHHHHHHHHRCQHGRHLPVFRKHGETDLCPTVNKIMVGNGNKCPDDERNKWSAPPGTDFHFRYVYDRLTNSAIKQEERDDEPTPRRWYCGSHLTYVVGRDCWSLLSIARFVNSDLLAQCWERIVLATFRVKICFWNNSKICCNWDITIRRKWYEI